LGWYCGVREFETAAPGLNAAALDSKLVFKWEKVWRRRELYAWSSKLQRRALTHLIG